MASTKTFVNIAGEGMKSSIQIPSPSTTLYIVLTEFCKLHNCKADNYQLSYKKKTLDLSLPWRLAGLANNCTLDVEPAKRAKKGGVGTASIAIQVDQNRYIGTYPLKMTVWDVLLTCEKRNSAMNVTRTGKKDKKSKKLFYQLVIVNIMNNSIKTLEQLQTKTLVELGLRNGDNVLARVTFEQSTSTLEEMLPILDQYKLRSDDEFMPAVQTPTATIKQSAEQFPVNVGANPSATVVENLGAAPIVPQQIGQVGIQTKQMAIQPEQMAIQTKQIAIQAEQQSQPDQKILSGDPMILEQTQQDEQNYLPIQDQYAKEIRLYKLANVQFDKKEILALEDQDFELSREEFVGMLAKQEKEKSERELLKTNKMREFEQQKKTRVYPKCFVRFRYPSGLIIQASFQPNCKIAALYDFVVKTIEDEACPFFMYVTPPVKRLDNEKDSTLQELGFVPAVIINVALDKKRAKEAVNKEPEIKKQFLPLLQDLEAAMLPKITKIELKADEDKPEPAEFDKIKRARKEVENKVLVEKPPSSSQPKQQDQKPAKSSKIPAWFQLGKK